MDIDTHWSSQHSGKIYFVLKFKKILDPKLSLVKNSLFELDLKPRTGIFWFSSVLNF
jgi:hypothetical protein